MEMKLLPELWQDHCAGKLVVAVVVMTSLANPVWVKII
jgi:hypothetical protein